MPSLVRRTLRFIGKYAFLGIGKLVARPVRKNLRIFEQLVEDPQAVQAALLQRILRHHEDTGFGQDHFFKDIRDLESFRRHVPIAGYEAIEPYIERMRQGDYRALVADPVHMFALTSGTTASRKYIPVTSQYLADYKRGWNIWGLKVFRDHREVRLRPIVQMSGNWNEYQTQAGAPCGTVTGLTARMQKRIIRWLYSVPPCASDVEDALAKYYLVLRLSLIRKVGMIIAANPSTMINLARLGNEKRESLIRDIRDGTLAADVPIPDTIREALARRLKKKYVQRAQELEAIVDRTGTLYPKDYWHDFLLGNWTGGSVGAYLRHYPEYFGGAPVRDVGLIASEGRMTIPVDDATPSGVLDITSHYFEFIPEEEVDSPDPTVLRADEVQEGKNYYILPTTAFGLYRYQIYDVVRVTGFFKQTPLIEFLSKGAHFSNLTGEKISEYHVTKAMQDVLNDLGMKLTTYSLAPCWPSEEGTPYYGLFVERSDLQGDQGQQLALLLDQQLCERNIEYASKRSSLRLGPVRLELLPPGTWQEWDKNRLAQTGGTLEQYKHPCLINDPKLREKLPVEQEEPTTAL